MELAAASGETPAGRDRRARWQRWLVALLLMALTWTAYWPVHACGFINYDDPGYVTANRYVQEGLTLTGMRWAWSTTHTGYWHPLTWLSLMLDAQLMGPRPIGFHLTNVLLHGLNAALLYLVLRAMTGASGPLGASKTPGGSPVPRLRAMTGSGWRSALVAGVFAVHPLHVESVAWVSERKDVLSACLGLLAIGAYVRYVRRPSPGPYLAVAALLILSLLAKPMLVTLPALLLLLDYWPLKRLGRAPPTTGGPRGTAVRPIGALVLEKLPLFLIVGASGAWTFMAQRQYGGMESIKDYSLPQRCAGALVSHWAYIHSTFWPTGLALPYVRPAHWPGALVVSAALVLTAITVMALAQTRRRPWLLVGWLWFLGMLLPVIGLVQVGAQYRADRYTYLPGVGLLIMVAWSLPEVATAARRTVAALSAVPAAILLGLSVLTWRQAGIWRDTITLFSHTLAVTGPNWVAYQQIGAALLAQGKLESAADAYARSLAADPGNTLVNVDMGQILTRLGHTPEAIACYEAALRIDPACAPAHFNLAMALDQRGQPELALSHYRLALRNHASFNMPSINVGNAYARCGDLPAAATEFRQAIAENPDNPVAHALLGRALVGQGQVQAALAEFRRALALEPRNIGTLRALAEVLNASGHPEEAVEYLQQIVDLLPGDFEAQAALAEVLARLGRREQAMAHLRTAEALQPADERARQWVARLENELGAKNGGDTRP